jgi:cardiolipin synthase
MVSTAGLLLVLLGAGLLARHHLGGLWWVATGRLCDIADGIVANRTRTKSPLGGAVDAVFDKIGALAVLLAVGEAHIVPWLVVILIALPNAATSILAFYAWHQKKPLEPGRAGKISTVLYWVSLGCFMIAAAYSRAWLWPAYIILAPAIFLGFAATITYIRTLTNE